MAKLETVQHHRTANKELTCEHYKKFTLVWSKLLGELVKIAVWDFGTSATIERYKRKGREVPRKGRKELSVPVLCGRSLGVL